MGLRYRKVYSIQFTLLCRQRRRKCADWAPHPALPDSTFLSSSSSLFVHSKRIVSICEQRDWVILDRVSIDMAVVCIVYATVAQLSPFSSCYYTCALYIFCSALQMISLIPYAYGCKRTVPDLTSNAFARRWSGKAVVLLLGKSFLQFSISSFFSLF